MKPVINWKNFVLVVVALLLSWIMAFGPLFTLIASIRKRSLNGFLVYLSQSAGMLAVGLDGFGNVVCRDLFNALFIRSGGYSFGVFGETISKALGKNKDRGTLTKTGRLLADLLNLIDQGHVEKAAGLPYQPGVGLYQRVKEWLRKLVDRIINLLG